MSTTLLTAGFAAAEKIIARSLELDPGSRQKIKSLAPQVLHLKVNSALGFSSQDLNIYICFTDEGLELKNYYEGEITAQIEGSLIALANVFISGSRNLKDTGVNFTGSTSFLRDVNDLARELDLDWEELLCKIFGDLLGPQIAKMIRQQMQWRTDRLTNIARLAEEFLTHESGRALSKPELESFYQDVENLSARAEKLQFKLNQIKSNVESRQ